MKPLQYFPTKVKDVWVDNIFPTNEYLPMVLNNEDKRHASWHYLIIMKHLIVSLSMGMY